MDVVSTLLGYAIRTHIITSPRIYLLQRCFWVVVLLEKDAAEAIVSLGTGGNIFRLGNYPFTYQYI